MVASATSWSPNDPAATRTKWLEGAKQQSTEILLGALLASDSIPLQRLPVLLTMVEGRPDLERCLLAAGLPAVATAVLRSSLLQRLLPGGALHELVLAQLMAKLPELTSTELFQAAQMLAVWQPPTSSLEISSCATAVATTLVQRASGQSANDAAEVAAIAQALAALRPWLEFSASVATPAGPRIAGGGFTAAGTDTWSSSGGESRGGDQEGNATGLVGTAGPVEGARQGLEALIRRVADAGLPAADEAGAAALTALVAAAAAYDVEVPTDVMRVAAGIAGETSTSYGPPGSSQAAVDLAAQLIAQTCVRGYGDSGAVISATGVVATGEAETEGQPLLSCEQVRTLVASRLRPDLGPNEHGAFLRVLRDGLRDEVREQGLRDRRHRPWQDAQGQAPAALLPASGVRTMGQNQPEEAQEERLVRWQGNGGWASVAVVGLLQGLGEAAAAGGLDATALALSLECTEIAVAAASAVADSAAGSPSQAKGTWVPGGEDSDAVDTARRQLFTAIEALVAKPPAEGRSADSVCMLAAAAVRLHNCWPRVPVDGAATAALTATEASCAAAVAAALAAVEAAPLGSASIEALSALIAAPIQRPVLEQTAGQLQLTLPAGGFAWAPPEALSPSASAEAMPNSEVALARSDVGKDRAAAVMPVAPFAGAGPPTVVLPAPLLDILLERLADAAAEADREAGATTKKARPAAGKVGRKPRTSTETPQLSYEQATAVLKMVATAAEAAAAEAPSTSSPSEEQSQPPLALPPARAAAFRAAAMAAFRSLAQTIRRLDVLEATHLLHLLARCRRAGLVPNHPPLMWALHERLCVYATSSTSLSPPVVVGILRGCAELSWRPGLLLRELLLPLLRWLRSGAPLADSVGAASGDDRSPGEPFGGASGARSQVPPSATAAGEATIQVHERQAWKAGELRTVLMLLAQLGYRGRLAQACAKLGVEALLRDLADKAAKPEPQPAAEGAVAAEEEAEEARRRRQEIRAANLGALLRFCVALEYRGATVLRPLMQQLLQMPTSQVPVAVAAQAVWAAARLGIVGERLVRWALGCCQGSGKMATAPPQSIALLCWGLAKLGVRPPRAFLPVVTSVLVTQLAGFKPQELSTALFVLAKWRARLDAVTAPPSGSTTTTTATGDSSSPGAVAAVIARHLVATRDEYDGPALCTAVWALQRLAISGGANSAATASVDVDLGALASASVDLPSPASAAPTDLLAGHDSETTPASSPLDAEMLSALEGRLLAIWAQPMSHGATGEPRVVAAPIPDHHLLRFFDACSQCGYRPDRLLAAYLPSLQRRLRRLRYTSEPEPGSAAGAFMSRMLWSVSQTLYKFGVRDTQLWDSLELAAARCQEVIWPRHLAGLVAAMAGLGHYPDYWVERGLLRRLGLSLRDAAVPQAAQILQAIAAWRPGMAAALELEHAEDQASAATGGVGADAEAEQGAVDGQGNGLAAVAVAKAGGGRAEGKGSSADGAAPAKGGLRAPWRQPRPLTAMRFDLLRRVALTRLTELLVTPPPPPPQSPAAGPNSPAPSAGGSQGEAATASGGSALPTASAVPLAPPRNVTLSIALQLLASLATLRWQERAVTEALVRAVATLPVARRQRVPQVSRLLWALAALKLDVPELLDDLQAALMGLPPRRSLAAELSLLESGRPLSAMTTLQAAPLRLPGASAALVPGEAPPVAASAPGVSSPVKTTPAASSASPEAVEGGPTGEDKGGDVEGQAGQSVLASGEAAAAQREPPAAAAAVPSAAAASPSPAAALTSNASSSNGLLVRPAKPAASTEAQTVEAGAEAGSGPAGAGTGAGSASARFDPAAATAAAAAAIVQQYEQQLGGPMGLSRLPTEPWSPSEIYRILWSCAKMNRHPGPQILAAAERSWMEHLPVAAAPQAADGGSTAVTAALPLHTLTGLLWSLAVFRNHNGSFAQRLAEQLAARLRNDGGADEAAFNKQTLQLAACLLAAQADRSDSPLNTALPPEVRARVVGAWRARLAKRVAQPLGRYQSELVSVLRKMGLTVAANVSTPDGCVVVDVAVALTAAPQQQPQATAGPGVPPSAPVPPRLLALELVGPHNTAVNSPRIIGEAVIKYRLLQARGYLVVPIPCYEWDRIGHQDMWTKMVYLQAKIERRTTGLAAPAAGSAATVGPGRAGASSVAAAGGQQAAGQVVVGQGSTVGMWGNAGR